MNKTALLNELVDIYLGLTHTPEYVLNGVPFLSVKDISNGKIDFSKCSYITEEEYNSLPNGAKPQIGDMLFCRVGTIGKPVIIEPETPKFGSFVSLGYFRLKKNDLCKLKYLYYWMYSDSFFSQVKKNVKGASQVNLNTGWLSKFEIPLYSIEEQEDIISKLEHLDDLISTRKSQLNKLDMLVKSRFIEMFGDPVANPFNWKTVLLKNATSKIGSGATPKGGKESYQSEGITLIRSMNVHDGRFEYKDLAHITDEQAKQLDNVVIEENDVFINITGASVARSCIVPKHILPARVNQHVAIIRCISSMLNPVFANNMFLNISFKGQLLDIGESGGATRQAITKQQLEMLNVILPPIDLQNEFATFVEQTDKLKFEVKQALEKLEFLKKSLMQKYFG